MSKMQSFTFAVKFCSAMPSISFTCPAHISLGCCLSVIATFQMPRHRQIVRSYLYIYWIAPARRRMEIELRAVEIYSCSHFPLALISFGSLFNGAAPTLVSIFIFALKLLAQKFVARTNLNDGKAPALLLLLCVEWECEDGKLIIYFLD